MGIVLSLTSQCSFDIVKMNNRAENSYPVLFEFFFCYLHRAREINLLHKLTKACSLFEDISRLLTVLPFSDRSLKMTQLNFQNFTQIENRLIYGSLSTEAKL